MYDLDVYGVLEKLTSIPEVTLLISNPCVELWFLLHNQECKSELNTKRCVEKYESVSTDYKKGTLNAFDLQIFNQGEDAAIARAKKLNTPGNPSTTVYKLLEALREESL